MSFETAAPVAIVGNLNLDIRTSPIVSSEDLLRDGETNVKEIYESVGGGGANTAAAVATMGGQAHFCCAIGNDALGSHLAGFLEALGVRMHAVAKPVATGRSIALTWDTHYRHFLSSLPNARLLERADIDLDGLRREGCRSLYRADVWFADLMLASGNKSLLRRARQAGMETSLDINWDPLWSLDRGAEETRARIAWVRATLPDVSFVHGNERELAFFTGQQTPERCARLLMEWGARAVIVHRGALGCAAATSAGWREIPAAPVTQIVTETGTGDVFTAAFLLTADLPLEERLRACASAAARHLQGAPCYVPRLGTLAGESFGRG
jgi:sugar/nucleoside kinase (ribokinase family)